MDVLQPTENYSAARTNPAIHTGEALNHPSESGIGNESAEKENSDDTVYSCEFCHKTGFLTYNNLQFHMILHAGESFYNCGICKSTFNSSSLLVQHMRKHSRAVKYYCKACGREYKDRSALGKHIMNKHGDSANGKGDVKTFIESLSGFIIHTGEQPDKGLHKCKLCSAEFASKFTLKNHWDSHIGERRLYTCKTCGRSYKNSHTLQEHIDTHTGEKHWLCEYCGKSFASSTKQTRHVRIHTGQLPYVCEVCGKRFAQSSARKSHMRVHTGEQPYCCKICGKSYSHNVCLKAHMAVHKKDTA